MTGQNPVSNMFEITLHLELHQLCQAASIGGYFISPNDIADHHEAMELNHDIALITHLFAKIGIERSLQRNYEQIYPSHYPDDLRSLPMSTSGIANGYWGEYWTGKAQW
ncbi:MAG: hypothetical protein COB24_12650 [Hyphomicrobiales bacterium]|nr:MAG: hypothetical protein COB24_12650 [Hyphomicrobiales bacterium]